MVSAVHLDKRPPYCIARFNAGEVQIAVTAYPDHTEEEREAAKAEVLRLARICAKAIENDTYGQL